VVTRRETEFHITTQKLIMDSVRDQPETSTCVVVLVAVVIAILVEEAGADTAVLN
jgi:hypothetical protein